MAATKALQWAVLFFFLQVSDCEVIYLQWPCVIANNSVNVVTCTIDTNELTKAGCQASAAVVFDFKAAGASSGTNICGTSYPPTSCTPGSVTGNNACGCVDDSTPNKTTFEFRFRVDQSHNGGSLECKACINPSAPFSTDPAKNSRITIGDPCNGSNTCSGGICKATSETTCDYKTSSYKCDKNDPEGKKVALGLIPGYIGVVVGIVFLGIYCCCPDRWNRMCCECCQRTNNRNQQTPHNGTAGTNAKNETAELRAKTNNRHVN